MIEAFVFDMDGVLLDTESVCDRTWQIAGKEFGVSEEDSLKIVNLCRGTNKSDTRDIIRRELGESFDVEGFLKRTTECFVEIEKNEGIRVMPYARECLQFLKNSGYRLALASSTREVVVRKHLQAAELLDFFEVFFLFHQLFFLVFLSSMSSSLTSSLSDSDFFFLEGFAFFALGAIIKPNKLPHKPPAT